MDMKIPKIIHYCWLGNAEKPSDVENYIQKWRSILKDYKIMEWNEESFQFSEIECIYLQDAMKMKRWAFVTDYMRLYVLYKYGGIYLDTDIEMLKSFDDFLEYDSFIGLESSYTLCTAVIGAKPKQRWLKDLLTEYDQRKFVDDTGKIDNKPNSQYIFEYLSAKENLKDSHTVQKLSNGLVVFPQEYFSPINYLTMKTNITEQTYTIHHYNGTWKSERERRKDKILGLLTRIIGEKNRKRIKQIIKKE